MSYYFFSFSYLKIEMSKFALLGIRKSINFLRALPRSPYPHYNALGTSFLLTNPVLTSSSLHPCKAPSPLRLHRRSFPPTEDGKWRALTSFPFAKLHFPSDLRSFPCRRVQCSALYPRYANIKDPKGSGGNYGGWEVGTSVGREKMVETVHFSGAKGRVALRPLPSESKGIRTRPLHEERCIS